MKRDDVLSVALYPGSLAAALAGYWQLSRIAPEWLAVGLPVLLAALLLAWLERVRPKTRAWLPSKRTFGVDLLHSVISTAAPPALIRAVGFAALYAVGSQLAAYGAPLWPAYWPLPLQLLLALLIGEFGAYWVHRVCHRWPLWWRIHALHHSADQLHFLASGRNHPLNVLLSYSAQVAPLLLLGVNAESLAMMSVFTGVHGLLQHANVPMRTGPYNYFFSTPELHHFHHSKRLDESNTNFGSNLIVWDLVFGSYFNPHDRRASDQVGITELALRDNFWLHLALPFIYPRLTTSPNGISPTHARLNVDSSPTLARPEAHPAAHPAASNNSVVSGRQGRAGD